jgi:hypothetical protein
VSRIETDWPALFREHPDANDVEMAAILGCDRHTVWKYRRSLGLPRRPTRYAYCAPATSQVQVFFRDTDGDIVPALDAEAARRGIDRSKLCRVLLREALASLAATQARMGVVLDRAHEASGVVVKR